MTKKEQQLTLDSLLPKKDRPNLRVRSISERLRENPLGLATHPGLPRPKVLSEIAEAIQAGREAEAESARPWRIPKSALDAMRKAVEMVN